MKKLTDKYELPENSLMQWKEAIMKVVIGKVDEIKTRYKPQQVKPVLKDKIVVDYLNQIHSKFVLVPIDKAANNIAIICKRFYIEKLLHEIGLLNTLRALIVAGIKCCAINFWGTNFCDFGSKSQKLVPQMFPNSFNRKNKFRKISHFFQLQK